MLRALGPQSCPPANPAARRPSLGKRVLVAAVFFWLLIGAVFLSRAKEPDVNPADRTHVEFFTRREGDRVHFFVRNSELSEVTVTFRFETQNLNSDVRFPYTKTFRPGETEAFTLGPADVRKSWTYSYTNYYKLGSCDAIPDGYVYRLPYGPGRAFQVTQGYHGAFSHRGPDEYAIDWDLPEGTAVHAARGGLVVRVKDDSDRGGGDMSFDRYNNYVIIRHADGTLGQYCHLEKGGAKVVPGQRVRAGDVIAFSGDTGFSTGAHLHFCVFKVQDGEHRLSVPVLFRISDNREVTLKEGRTYQAPGASETRTAALSRGPGPLLK